MRAIFWLLTEAHQVPMSLRQDCDNIVHYMACVLASDLYRQNKKVLLLTADQDAAQDVDELLWQFQAHRFVPHNLPGEGPHYGSPVEVNWQAGTSRKQCVVNCKPQSPYDIAEYKGLREWHDFVPVDEAGKQAARERYKVLRELGVQVSTNDIPSILE